MASFYFVEIFRRFVIMLRNTVLLISFIISVSSIAQEGKLANEYFVKGEFEKALNLYQQEYNKQKHSIYFFKKILKCQQALEDYEKAAHLIEERFISFPNQDFLWVELGYNLDLQHKTAEAKVNYAKATAAVQKKPMSSYQIAKSFQENHLLDYALDTYLSMVEANPNANYNYQIAALYGEKGDIEKMFETYLDMIYKQGGTLGNIQNFIGKYVSDDALDVNNILFKKLLIKRLQENPQDEWNKLLSWIYLQQKDFGRALIQEKAVHKRNQTGLDAIIELGKIAFDSSDFETTKNAFDYILNNSTENELQIIAHYYLLESGKTLEKDFGKMDAAYQSVFEQYGKGHNSLKIQISYAEFLTFIQNNPEKAIQVLQSSLENRLNSFQKAQVKILLADILVFTGKYNQALISYSQVQTQLRNHVLAQEARYKVARTSYFKGDFEWANIQLKVLKKGTTKLIANDAIDLSLLIDDNIAQDSIQIALKSYAAADLLAYQNKNQQAIDSLSHILLKHKGHPIEDEALFRQATLFEQMEKYEMAAQNYLNLLALENDDILIDDALFSLAELYDTFLERPDKAKNYYEKIVLDYPSSIYLVDARKRFRQLRGDVLVP